MLDKNDIVWLSTVLGAFAGIAVFFRRFIAFGTAPVRWILEQSRCADDVQRILKELLPNGGTSMRDSVNRIEENQKKTDRRVTLNEQIARASHSDAMHGIFQSDEIGRCHWVNSSYCKMVGRLPLEVQGDGWESYIYFQDRSAVLDEWKRTVASNREFQMQYRLTSGVMVDVVAHPLRDDDGNLIGYQGSMRMVEKPPIV